MLWKEVSDSQLMSNVPWQTNSCEYKSQGEPCKDKETSYAYYCQDKTRDWSKLQGSVFKRPGLYILHVYALLSSDVSWMCVSESL